MSSEPSNIVIIGGSGGLGHAMTEQICRHFPDSKIDATFFRTDPAIKASNLEWHRLDITDIDAIERFSAPFKSVDWLLNFTGFLHGEQGRPEKTIRSVTADFFAENMQVNCLATLMLAKHFSAALRKSPKPLFASLSAKVGSIEDNRLGGWYSYRISKAALNMALKTLSIEWKHSHPKGCIAALHPGTNDTRLSKPFQANVKPEALFSPAYTASMFLKLLKNLEPDQSGQFWAWDGEKLPW